MNPDDLIKLVHNAIDNGATTVEQFHRSIAAKPFNAAAKIDPIASQAEMAKDMHDSMLASGYDLARSLNDKAGEAASAALGLVFSKIGK